MSSPGSRVSIVVPTFNRADLTLRCLAALRETATDAEVIVVDNGSTDATPTLLKSDPGVVPILNSINHFFGPACNQGARAATRELVVFLNNDTITKPGWLEALVGCLDADPGVGAVGARLLFPDGRVQHAGVGFREPGVPFHAHRFADGNDPQVLVDRDCVAVTGACLLMERELFLALGGFDESYVMYVEDVDLCLRVWKAGLRVRYCAESVVEHLESASTTDLARRDALVREGWGKMHARFGGDWPAAVLALPGWPASLGGVPRDTRFPGARGFVVAAFADELSARPDLLAAYGRAIGEGDDATLAVVADPGADVAQDLEDALAVAGLDPDTCADLLVVPSDAHDRRLASAVDAVLTELPLEGPLAALPRFGRRDLTALASLARRGLLAQAA